MVRERGRVFFRPDDSDLILGPVAGGAVSAGLPRRAHLVARSGNIRLAPGNGGSRAGPNSWPARVEHWSLHHTHVDVICRGGGRWRVALSVADWRRMGLEKGDAVQLSLKEEDLHVI